MKKIFTFLLLFALFTLLSSHEFWLNPEKFIYNRGEKINIRFYVGENFEGENWKGNNEKIQSLKLYYGGVSDDLSNNISDEKGDSIELTMLDEGINLVAFNSTNTFIEIEAPDFNKYLYDDGLTNAIEYRKQNNETDSTGREFYQRCSKTLIQVGNKKDKTWSITTDLPVDIIPLSNPYDLKKDSLLKVKVLFQKQPMANSLIVAWHREKGKTIKLELISNGKGEVSFPVSASGAWMVSAVKMERLQNDTKAQWQSYWGSLTWGYE